MTVVAYSAKHATLASDSRCSDGDMHFSYMRKLFRLRNGALLGGSGDTDLRDVIALLGQATPRKLPSRATLAALKTEFCGVLVFPKGQLYTITIECRSFPNSDEWHGTVDTVYDRMVAVGSGAKFAYGAMEAGASPAQAVRVACRRDLACGGPVQSERL